MRPNPIEDLFAQISTIATSMWRFRWPSLLVAWLVGIAAAAVVLLIPNQYEAQARISPASSRRGAPRFCSVPRF